MNRLKAAAMAVTAVLAALCTAQEEAPLHRTLTPAPKEGDTSVWAIELKFEAMGQPASFTGKLQRSILKVHPDGSYEVESRLIDAKVLVMGSEMPQASEPSVRKFDKNGASSEPTEDTSELEELMRAYFAADLPADGAKLGQRWPLAGKNGPKGKGELELTGEATVADRKCLALKMTYKVATGEGTSEGTVHIEPATGVLVAVDAKFSKLTVGPGLQSGGTLAVKLLEHKSR